MNASRDFFEQNFTSDIMGALIETQRFGWDFYQIERDEVIHLAYFALSDCDSGYEEYGGCRTMRFSMPIEQWTAEVDERLSLSPDERIEQDSGKPSEETCRYALDLALMLAGEADTKMDVMLLFWGMAVMQNLTEGGWIE